MSHVNTSVLCPTCGNNFAYFSDAVAGLRLRCERLGQIADAKQEKINEWVEKERRAQAKIVDLEASLDCLQQLEAAVRETTNEVLHYKISYPKIWLAMMAIDRAREGERDADEAQ